MIQQVLWQPSRVMKRFMTENRGVRRFLLVLLVFSWVFSLPLAQAELPQEEHVLTAVWSISPKSQILKSWSMKALSHLKNLNSQERDPATGRLNAWKGVLLSSLIEDVLHTLSPEDKSQFDLVILHGQKGQTAFIPRATITKYPFLIAVDHKGGSKTSLSSSSLYSVVPWTSKPRIMNEELPLETFFVSELNQIELANFKSLASHLFLQRRTDPSAMRGEKIFVQSCPTCQINGHETKLLDEGVEQKTKLVFLEQHPELKGLVKLSDKNRKAVQRYLEAYRMEHAVSLSSTTPSPFKGTGTN